MNCVDFPKIYLGKKWRKQTRICQISFNVFEFLAVKLYTPKGINLRKQIDAVYTWRLVFDSFSLVLAPREIRDAFFFAVAKSRALQQQNKRVMNLIRLEKERTADRNPQKFKSNEMCCYLFFMREATSDTRDRNSSFSV